MLRLERSIRTDTSKAIRSFLEKVDRRFSMSTALVRTFDFDQSTFQALPQDCEWSLRV